MGYTLYIYRSLECSKELTEKDIDDIHERYEHVCIDGNEIEFEEYYGLSPDDDFYEELKDLFSFLKSKKVLLNGELILDYSEICEDNDKLIIKNSEIAEKITAGFLDDVSTDDLLKELKNRGYIPDLKIYEYDICDSDKGIIFADSYEKAKEIFSDNYPDADPECYDYTEIDESKYSYGAQINELCTYDGTGGLVCIIS